MIEQRVCANTLPTPSLNRRRFLSASGAIGLAPIASAASIHPSLGPVSDPIPGLIAERERLVSLWIEAEEDTPESNRLEGEWLAAEDKIYSTPATSREGLSAQMEFFRDQYAHVQGMPLQGGDPSMLMMETLSAALTGYLA